MRAHLQAIYEQFGRVKGLGMDRYSTLHASLNPSIDEILEVCDLLRATFNEFVTNVKLAVVDEAVLAYQPSKEAKEKAEAESEPIPTVHIPRKPHPNGLEIFLVTTPVEHGTTQKHLPYIIDILPHLRKGDSAADNVVKKFMKRWTSSAKPHVLGDSAFWLP
jgi:hypothetical protein